MCLREYLVGRGGGTIWTLYPKTEAIASDLSNFQREPGQATVSVSFPSSAEQLPSALRVSGDARDAENQRRAGRRASRRDWNKVAE